MADCINVPYPQRHIDPDELGLAAAYTFADNELAQFGRYLNRARTGAAYDLTTRVGTPLVGQGGGVHVVEQPGSYWQGAFYPSGASNWSYSIILNNNALVLNPQLITRNGSHAFAVWNNGRIRFTADAGGTYSEAPFYCVGYGPIMYEASYDGVNQVLCANGRFADSDAVAPAVPAGNSRVGNHCETLLYKMYSVRRTVPQARQSYVREFARRVVYSWTPRDVGEGPAGGLVTGSTGDEWRCILGGANFKFVWVTDPRLRQRQLALNEVDNKNLSRIELHHSKMPSFGSWRAGILARSLTTETDMYLAQVPGQTWTAAASGCYWWRTTASGGYWTLSLLRENVGPLISVTNTSKGTESGDILEPVITRHPSGDWRAYLGVNGNWSNQGVNVVNDVTYLSSNFVGIVPKGGHVLGMTIYQGEMLPGEMPRSDWYAPSLWSLLW